MDIRRVYNQFSDRINSLTSNQAQHIGGLRQFVDVFNTATLSLIHDAIQAESLTDDVQEFLAVIREEKRLVGVEHGRYYLFTLPEDLEHIDTVYIDGLRGGCTHDIYVRIVPSGEENIRYMDSLSAPSFDYQETFATLIANKLRVFYNDFAIQRAHLTYYRKPILVNIEGFIMEDGSPSVNINPEWEGTHLQRIIDRAAQLHLKYSNNPQYQLFT